MTKFSKNSRKAYFLVHFEPILPFLGKVKVFPKNRALPLLSPCGPLTSCTISRATNERIPIKKACYGWTNERTDELTGGRTDEQTRIHRTLPQGGDPIKVDGYKKKVPL